jgi:hypothetical protein
VVSYGSLLGPPLGKPLLTSRLSLTRRGGSIVMMPGPARLSAGIPPNCSPSRRARAGNA